MKNTKHGHTNFKGLYPLIGDMARPGTEGPTHKRYQAGPCFMPLVLEYLGYTDHKGNPVYSITHYSEQNGDAMRDPDMTFSVDWKEETVEPLTYENSYAGLYQEVYHRNENGTLLYSPRLRTDLDQFLWQWLDNIRQQGYILER